MLTIRLQDCNEIAAPDGCRLQEFLHPRRDEVDLPFSMAVAELDGGQATSPHRLLAQSEVYHFLEGEGYAHVGGETQPVAAGDLVVVPAGISQWVENTGAAILRFAVIVSPPWQAEDDVPVDL